LFESSGVFFTGQALEHQKGVRSDAQGGVMMESTPVAAFVMTEAEFGFEFSGPWRW
jgi:hypothetical protein